MTRALGRNTPPDWGHLTAKPLAAATLVKPTPVVVGVNWYEAFDRPHQLHDGSWHVPDASRESLGKVRGGHAFCLVQLNGTKLLNERWQVFYDQQEEPACEGFSHAKAQSLQKGVTFDPYRPYDEARKLEGTFPGGEGTTNRSLVAALEKYGAPEQTGPKVAQRGAKDTNTQHVGSARWTISVDEVLTALGRPNAHAVPFSNSWGLEYPLVTWMPVPTLDRLLREEGEADCCVDR